MIYAPDQQALRAADLCNKALRNYINFLDFSFKGMRF